MEITLFFTPRTRARTALWMLEEVGADYTLQPVNIRDDIQNEAFAAVNPMRKVPTLRADGEIITETGAICAFLADAHPDAGLAPGIGEKGRGAWLRWLFFSGSAIEPAFMDKGQDRATPAASAGWGNVDRVLATLRSGLTGKDFLVNDRFTAADLVVGSTLGFLMQFGLLEKEEPFVSYVARLRERDAFQRASAKDDELAETMM